MESQTDWNLILRYLSNSLTGEEKEKINSWLNSDFENQKLMDLLKEIWCSPEKKPLESDLKLAWEKLAKKAGISCPTEDSPAKILPLTSSTTKKAAFIRQIPAYQILRYAAVLVIMFSLTYLYKVMTSSNFDEQKAEMQQILVDYGKQAKLTLTDGTKITLDAGSSLSYPSHFKGEVREVFLSGEGFFEVAHNSQKPFIINANEAVIKVLGTKFNIRAWRQNRRVKVAVAEGKVSLRSKIHTEEAAIVIAKGRMSILHDRDKLTMPVPVDVAKHLAWLKREMIFENTPLIEVLDQLERWYEIRFKLPSPIYNQIKISGTIKKKPIIDILEAISLMINLEFKLNGKRVVFFQKSSERTLF